MFKAIFRASYDIISFLEKILPSSIDLLKLALPPY
jgi:hypothetical protein